eukprot:m.155084 g.155084  ORF g.155084 m.155084 type:complete len:573 (-) comp14305_c0_seq4:470-2188(-)
MFVPVEAFADAYSEITALALKDECAVLILVGCDIDGICASIILKDLFISDYVKYQLLPVHDYDDIDRAKQLIDEGENQFRAVVMLNCGGNVDVCETLDIGPGRPNDGLAVFIIDAHRPLNLENVFSSDVRVFDDGETQRTIPPQDEIILSDDEEDDDDFDEEGKRVKVGEQGERLTRKMRQVQRDAILEDYYAASSFSIAASVLLWNLVCDLNRGSNRLLWFSVLGLTDQFVHNKTSTSLYAEQAVRLQTDLSKYNSDEQESSHKGVQLASHQDLRFFLMRHWTLYDAMRHSSYVVGRIPIWLNQGHSKLLNLFARMGVPLKTCRQIYSTLSKDTKQRISDQLLEVGPAYGLDQLTFPSFTYQVGYKTPVSASDVVHAASALLNSTTTSPHDRFYQAIDVLSLEQDDLFLQGVELAKAQERAILTQVQSHFQSSLDSKRRTRFVEVGDESHATFLSAPMLLKLGNYVSEVLRFEALGKFPTQQLVISVRDLDQDRTMAVGLWAKKGRSEGVVDPNTFASVFQRIAEASGCEYRAMSFDPAVIEIKAEQFPRFAIAVATDINRILRRDRDLHA